MTAHLLRMRSRPVAVRRAGTALLALWAAAVAVLSARGVQVPAWAAVGALAGLAGFAVGRRRAVTALEPAPAIAASELRHELTNLIVPVRAYAQLALHALEQGADAREDVAEVLTAAERAADFARSLGDPSRS